MPPPLICASHTISGVMPGDPTVQRHGFEARVAAVAAAGFDGIGLHMRDHAQLRQQGWSDVDLRAVLARHGLRAESVEFLSDWHADTFASQSSRARAFAAAEGFGAKIVNAGIDAGDERMPLADLVEPLKRLVDAAAARSLSVALEFVSWGACERLEQAVALAEVAGAGLLVDVWHLAWRGILPDDLAAVPAGRVLGVQISDSLAPGHAPVRDATLSRGFPGEGVLDLPAYLAAMAKNHWTAPISVEVISPRVAALDVEICARLAYDSAWPRIDTAWRAMHAA